jgi:hypothetical protein
MNLIELIDREMDGDYEDTTDQSERLIDLYQRADAAGKKLIDDAFICLCGWSMTSLLSKVSELQTQP